MHRAQILHEVWMNTNQLHHINVFVSREEVRGLVKKGIVSGRSGRNIDYDIDCVSIDCCGEAIEDGCKNGWFSENKLMEFVDSIETPTTQHNALMKVLWALGVKKPSWFWCKECYARHKDDPNEANREAILARLKVAIVHMAEAALEIYALNQMAKQEKIDQLEVFVESVYVAEQAMKLVESPRRQDE